MRYGALITSGWNQKVSSKSSQKNKQSINFRNYNNTIEESREQKKYCYMYI